MFLFLSGSGLRSMETWYKLGQTNPLVSLGATTMMVGGGMYLGGKLSKSEEKSGKLEKASYYVMGVGALITLAGVFLSKTSKPLGPTNPNPATTAVKVSRLAGTYNVLKGIPLATAKLGLDMTVGSLGNLITVIAPLHGVVEGTSLISKKYLAPSAYTDLEYAMANSILGAFWITPLEAKRYGNINLASRIKYEDLISRWNSSDSFLNRYLLPEDLPKGLIYPDFMEYGRARI